jgi:uncharacterized protein YhaN
LVGQLDESDAAQKQDEAEIEELRVAVDERDLEINALTEEGVELTSDLKKVRCSSSFE